MTRNGTPETAQVAVMMGSDSDLPVMRACLEQMDKLGVPYDCVVASAHRTPERVARYVERCERGGVKVFVCAAGGAAHLAGAVAAKTTLPVIGVPMDATPLAGVDALYATVQMPPGFPVATVAIGKFGATNAALLAAQIVALTDPGLAERVRAHRVATREGALAKNARLRDELGLPAEE